MSPWFYCLSSKQALQGIAMKSRGTFHLDFLRYLTSNRVREDIDVVKYVRPACHIIAKTIHWQSSANIEFLYLFLR